MAKQCPICPKQFDSKAALKGHTGTADPTVRKPHVCPKCDKTFCSKRAMEQHRDAPSHKSMFSCDVCKKQFGSKPAVAQHQKSLSHERILAGAKLARGSAMDAVTNTGNATSSRNEPHIPTLSLVPLPDYTHSGSNTDEESYSDEGAWANDSRVGWDDEQDWILCDKDCGWCGHCADGVDY